MNEKTKAVLLTLLFGLPTIPLGIRIWKPLIMPTPDQIPFYIILSFFEALGFGGGIAFLILTRKYLLKAAHMRREKTAVYVSLAWLMISWWPHGHIHSTLRPTDFQHVIVVEYAFHALSIVAAVAAALGVYTIFKNSARQ